MAITHTEPTVNNINRQQKTLFGHPKGLAFIVFTETWERFSFYGMQALLILYMANYLLLPENSHNVIGFELIKASVQSVFGELSRNAMATQLFGLYIGLVYFMPVLGGWIGDRFFGKTNSVLFGALLMAIGHFMMAVEMLFFFSLLMVILGSGLLKGNLASQVGNLYKKDDQKRDTAFTMYSVAINVGGFVAPLVCGTLGELYGWHYGFSCAAIGMLIGIVIYLSGLKHLPKEASPQDHQSQDQLKSGDMKIVVGLVGLLAITSLYWTTQSQVWTTYPLWISDRVDRQFMGFIVPVTWFQSLDMLAVLLLAPVVMWFWRKQAAESTEPSMLRKISIGCLVFSLAYVWLALSELMSGSVKVSLFWPVIFHFICAVGFLYIGPITLSVVSQSAPVSVNAMMMGSYYLAIFIGGIASGYIGKYYEILDSYEFWLIHAIIVCLGAVLITLFYKRFKRTLKLNT